MPYPPIDVTGQWKKTNDAIVSLVDYIPDDKLNWSPREGLWNFKGILIHTIMVRDNWLANAVRDGEPTPNVLELAQTKDGIREQLARTWARVERWVSDPAKLDTVYEGEWAREGFALSGHELAFGQLEHAIHHRADLHHYLRELAIDPGEPDTVARKMNEG